MLGYTEKLLYVDLSKGSTKAREIPEKLAKTFLGGRGLGAALLHKEVDA